MPTSQGIAFIVYLYLHFLHSCLRVFCLFIYLFFCSHIKSENLSTDLFDPEMGP